MHPQQSDIRGDDSPRFHIYHYVHFVRGDFMQLRLQRSQRTSGVVGRTVLFCLDVRADYSPEERANIERYKLGGEVIYNSQSARKHLDQAGVHLSRTQAGNTGERAAGLARGALSLALARMSLSISIGSLARGHHVECKDLEELLGAEETVRTACKNVTRYLEAAQTFNGSETVIEYDKGEERVEVRQAAAPLLTYISSDAGSSATKDAKSLWDDPEFRNLCYVGVGFIALLIGLSWYVRWPHF
jgi:hypothetical protein